MDSHTENNLRQAVPTAMELLAQARTRIKSLEDVLENAEVALLRVSLGMVPSGEIASYTSASANLINEFLRPNNQH